VECFIYLDSMITNVECFIYLDSMITNVECFIYSDSMITNVECFIYSNSMITNVECFIYMDSMKTNVECFIYLDSMITNDARCTRETKFRTAKAKAGFNKKKLFTSKLVSSLRKNLVKCYIWSTALYGAETWTLWKTKYLIISETWCWRMENIR
jgi:hypothetical protein